MEEYIGVIFFVLYIIYSIYKAATKGSTQDEYSFPTEGEKGESKSFEDIIRELQEQQSPPPAEPAPEPEVVVTAQQKAADRASHHDVELTTMFDEDDSNNTSELPESKVFTYDDRYAKAAKSKPKSNILAKLEQIEAKAAIAQAKPKKQKRKKPINFSKFKFNLKDAILYDIILNKKY